MDDRKQPTPAAPDAAVLRALADPHRRQILRLVQHAELPAGQIAASFTLTQQAVSQHIGVLRQGLLAEHREGIRRLYTLNHQALEPVRELAVRVLARRPAPPEAGRRDGPSPTAGEVAVVHRIRNDVIVTETERIEAPPEVVFPCFTVPTLIVT